MKKPKEAPRHPQQTKKTLRQKLHSSYSLIRSFMKKQKGFTLIELMVVMAIIAILATAGLSAYTGYIKKARDSVRLSIASQINNAVTALMGSNGGVTPSNEELIAYLDTLSMTAAVEALQPRKEEVYIASATSTLKNLLGAGLAYAGIKEPSGGRAICIGKNSSDQWVSGFSCAFRYLVYNDDSYAITYGIESQSNVKDIYKIQYQLPAGTRVDYMQAVGTAPYIGGDTYEDNGETIPTSVGNGINASKSGVIPTAGATDTDGFGLPNGWTEPDGTDYPSGS